MGELTTVYDDVQRIEEIDPEVGRHLADISAQAKILISQSQILGSFANIEILWPPAFLSLTHLGDLFKFDLVSLLGLGCIAPMGYYTILIMHIVGPLVLFGLIWVKSVFLDLVFVHGWTRKQGSNNRSSLRMFIAFLVYPIVSQVILEAFSCRLVLGKYYLAADMSKECYDEEWTMYAIVAAFGVLLFPIGLQLYSYVPLERSRHKLYSSPKMMERYGILFARCELPLP